MEDDAEDPNAPKPLTQVMLRPRSLLLYQGGAYALRHGIRDAAVDKVSERCANVDDLILKKKSAPAGSDAGAGASAGAEPGAGAAAVRVNTHKMTASIPAGAPRGAGRAVSIRTPHTFSLSQLKAYTRKNAWLFIGG